MIGPTGGGPSMNMGGMAPGLNMSMPGLPATRMPGMAQTMAMPMGAPMAAQTMAMPMQMRGVAPIGGIRGAMRMLPRFGYRPGMPGMGIPGLVMAQVDADEQREE